MSDALDNVTTCSQLVFNEIEAPNSVVSALSSLNDDVALHLSDDLLCDHEEFPFCDCLAIYAGRTAANSNNEQTTSSDVCLKDLRVKGYAKRTISCRSLDSWSSPRSSTLEILEEAEENDIQETEGAVAVVKSETEVQNNGSLLPLMDLGIRRASIVTSDTRSEKLCTDGEPIRIAVFGIDGVGKSALIVRLVTGRFIGEYDPSMEAIYNYQIPLQGHTIPLQVMDTAGNVDANEKGRESQVSWGEGFLLVFSLTNHESLLALQHVRRTLVDLTPGSPRPIVLVGNKADLSQARDVNSTEIIDLANLWGCDYFEVSAAEPWDVVVRPFSALYGLIQDARVSVNYKY